MEIRSFYERKENVAVVAVGDQSFTPSSFTDGKLQVPFLTLHHMENSSQLPVTEPVISPFFALSSIDFPTRTRSQRIFPPLVLRLTLSVKDSDVILIFSLDVTADKYFIKGSAVFEIKRRGAAWKSKYGDRRIWCRGHGASREKYESRKRRHRKENKRKR